MPTVEFGKALYFPSINFHDRTGWLKVAALYHDKLCRIVPNAYQPPDSDEVKALRDEGFIENRTPDEGPAEILDEFFDFAFDTLMNPERRRSIRKDLRRTSVWNHVYFHDINPELAWMRGGREVWGRIHIEKIAPVLAEMLEEMGLLRHRSGDPEWYEVEMITGTLYMLFLAKKLAGPLPIITDDPAPLRLAYGTPSLKLPDDMPRGDKGYCIASAVLKTHVPVDPASIPISTIVDIRRRYRDERTAFYNAVGTLAKDMDTIRDEKDMPDAIAHHEASVARALDSLRAKLANHRLTLKTGLWGLSVPSVAKMAGVQNTVALTGLGVITAGAVVWKHFRDIRSARLESSWSYLLTLSDELAPRVVDDHFLRLGLAERAYYAPRQEALADQFKRFLKRVGRADF
jgi:hypothetical protein